MKPVTTTPNLPLSREEKTKDDCAGVPSACPDSLLRPPLRRRHANMPTAGPYVGIILGNTSCALFAFNRQWLISRLPRSSSHGSPASLRAPPGRCATHNNCALPRQAPTHRTARLHGCFERRSCLPTADRIRCARERSVQTLHVSKRPSNMSAVLRSLCSSTRSNAVHRLARRTPGRNAYQTRTNNCLATRPGL